MMPTRVVTLGSLRWWVWLIVAVVIGFSLACLSAAALSLQAPAGPVLCRGGTFLAGNDSVPSGDRRPSGRNIDSVCVGANGAVHHISQVSIVGVLWLEYTLAALIPLMLLVGLGRARRRTRDPVEIS